MLEIADRNWEALERGASTCRQKYQDMLAQTLSDGPPWQIDEVALAFPDKRQQDSFVDDAINIRGWERIGQEWGVPQLVHCEPFTASYRVAYDWLNPHLNEPAVLFSDNFAGEDLVITSDWRVECMRLYGGYNAIFEHWKWMVGRRSRSQLDNYGWMHAAFKVPSLAIFQDVCYTLARRGWVPVQQCSSDYGKFSYFKMEPDWLEAVRTEDPAFPLLYLKARVNLRDKPKSLDE